MMVPPIVVLDACVLYPAALRDLLMRLAAHHLIRAKWSEKIHEEWMTAILRERPDLRMEQLQRTRQLMDKHAGDCLVTGFEKHIPGLLLPDLDDRHVLAAAIESGAGAVVTWNLSDFPESALEPFGIELWTPDQLISQLIEVESEQMIAIMQEHRASLKNPPRSPEEYLETLLGQGMKDTVAAISSRVGEI